GGRLRAVDAASAAHLGTDVGLGTLMSVLLSGGMVTTASQSRLASVRSGDGRIVEIGDLAPRPGEEVVDCTGCLVLPGGIETHTHLDLEAMGTVTADDLASGTRSALAGCTTTVPDLATHFHGESLLHGQTE